MLAAHAVRFQMQLETQVNIGKIQFSIPNSQSPPQENNYDSRKASLEVGQMSFVLVLSTLLTFLFVLTYLTTQYLGLKQTIPLQIFKGCLPQILLGPFLNTLTHLVLLLVFAYYLKRQNWELFTVTLDVFSITYFSGLFIDRQ